MEHGKAGVSVVGVITIVFVILKLVYEYALEIVRGEQE